MTHINQKDQKERGDSETDPRQLKRNSYRAGINASVIELHKQECTVIGNFPGVIIGVTEGAHINELSSNDPRDHIHVYEGASVADLTLSEGEHEIAFGSYVANLTVLAGAVVHVSGHVGKLEALANSQVVIYRGAYVDQLHVSSGAYVRAENFSTVFYADIIEGGRFLMEKYVTLQVVSDETRQRIIPYMSDPAESYVHVVMQFPTEAYAIECCKELTLEYKETEMLQFDGLIIAHLTRCRCLDEYVEDKEGHTMVEFYADGIDCWQRGIGCKIQKRFPKAQVTVEIDSKSELLWVQEHQDEIDDLPRPEIKEIAKPITTCSSGYYEDVALFRPCCQADD